MIAVSPEVRGSSQVLANGLNWATRILGESEDYLAIRQWPLAEGAMFTEQDVRGNGKVCVIGQTIVNNLFPDGDPVGKTIRMRNLPFKVLGRARPKGFSLQGVDQDDMVMIPYTSAMKRFSRQTYLPHINVQADSADRMLGRRGGHRRAPARPPSHSPRGATTTSPCATSRRSPTPPTRPTGR